MPPKTRSNKKRASKASKPKAVMPTIYPRLIPITSNAKGIKVSSNIMYKEAK